MKKNMGNIDRITRVGIAVIIWLLYFNSIITGGWAIFLMALAVIFVLTSFLSFCPLYVPFGISTLLKRKPKH